MKNTILLALAISCLTATSALATDSRTPDAVLARLKSGNARYMTGHSSHVRIDAARREESATYGQKPYATVLGCSDSRVPPEIVFDQGFAELFVIRVAGNVCGESELASAEYGAKYLGTQLLVVLGHTQCGAVDATVSGKQLKGSLPKLASMIQPAVDKAIHDHPNAEGEALLNHAIETNVRQTMRELLEGSTVLQKLVDQKQLKIVGAVRNLKTGEVRWLD